VRLVDTHCHLDAQQFAAEPAAAVVRRARKAGVEWVVSIGTDETSSERATRLAGEHDAVYAAVGVDPNDAADWDAGRLAAVDALSRRPKVVAIGEIGLDYYWDRVPRATQAAAFRDQLALAAERRLPVVVHNREADADTESTLLEWAAAHPLRDERPLGVLHCFSGSAPMARRLAGAGFMISFAGNVTYPSAEELQAACRAVPDAHLVLETDSPYLAPQGHRGERNEPARVREIAGFVAVLRGKTLAELAALTTANAERLFGVAAA
jgi:TatD DNase family protein